MGGELCSPKRHFGVNEPKETYPLGVAAGASVVFFLGGEAMSQPRKMPPAPDDKKPEEVTDLWCFGGRYRASKVCGSGLNPFKKWWLMVSGREGRRGTKKGGLE